MNCTNGHSVPSDSQFCPYCGVSSFAADQPQQADASSASQSPWTPPQASDRVIEDSRVLSEDPHRDRAPISYEQVATVPRATKAQKSKKVPLLIGLVVALLGAVVVVAVVMGSSRSSSGNSSGSGSSTAIAVTLDIGVACVGVSLLYSDVPGGTLLLNLDSGSSYRTTFDQGTPTTNKYGETICSFKASFRDVPKTARTYTFGTGQRGSVSATQQELSSKGWTFYMSIQ